MRKNIVINFRETNTPTILEDVKKIELINTGIGVLSVLLANNRENFCYPLDTIRTYKVTMVSEDPSKDFEKSENPYAE